MTLLQITISILFVLGLCGFALILCSNDDDDTEGGCAP